MKNVLIIGSARLCLGCSICFVIMKKGFLFSFLPWGFICIH